MTILKISRKKKKTPLKEIMLTNTIRLRKGVPKERILSRAISIRELERRNVICELIKGDQSLIKDLENVEKYGTKMMYSFTGEICNGIDIIFKFARIVRPLHVDLVNRLERKRNIGEIFMKWLSTLDLYETYARDLVETKIYYDLFKQHGKTSMIINYWPKTEESRRLDLWSFIDAPRSRLMRYPLLLERLITLTDSQTEKNRLNLAISQIKAMLQKFNLLYGEQMVHSILSRLVIPNGMLNEVKLILNAQTLLYSDQLSSHKGNKLQTFLFDNVLIFTKENSSAHKLVYELVKYPILVDQMGLQDISSLRTIKGPTTNAFRVYDNNVSVVVQARDSMHKSCWLEQLSQLI